MRRLSLPLLLVALLATSACSALGTAPAATVSGTEISTDSIEDEMETIRGNEAYTEVLEQTYGLPTEGRAGTGTFDAAFVAQVLSLRVYYELIEDHLDERGLLPIPDDLRDEAEASISEQFGQLDPGAWERFPASYQERLVEQRALLDLLQRAVEDEIGDDEEAFFEENPEEFVEACISHILVGLQGDRTPAEAQAEAAELREQLEEGDVSFAELAQSASDDPGSAAQGGALGCGSRRQLQFDPVFEEAAFSLEEGVPSEPVQTQFGSHIILVTERRVPEFADVARSVGLVMSEVRQERFDELILDVICGGDVSVNPRYGTWVDDGCDAARPDLPRVVPPEGPESSDEGIEFQL